MVEFNWEAHRQYFRRLATKLPVQYTTMETNRLTLLYFCVSGLDLLDHAWEPNEISSLCDFIYSHQHEDGGFSGGGLDDSPHIANTYAALCCLAILGDDFSEVRRDALGDLLRQWQQPDGSFTCSGEGGESDIRFCFCACAIAEFLHLWTFDVSQVTEYILRSQSYDGAIGMGPYLESHGGSTYCGVSALCLSGTLNLLPRKEQLIKWLTQRQVGGFQGRVGKPPDSCYSFWIIASLQILGHARLVNIEDVEYFLFAIIFTMRTKF